VLRAFGREFDRSFLALPSGSPVLRGEALGRSSVETLEEQVALAQLAKHTARTLGTPLLALGHCLQHAARALGVEISPRVLSPQSLCDAWATTLRGAELSYDERLLLHPLFERHVLGRLGPVIDTALRTVERHGWRALTTDGALAPDAPTLAALELAAAPGGAPADIALATTLRDSFTPALRQRLGLVGALFNEILGDANLAPGLAPLFEPLRFVVIKAALADARFFSHSDHPLRERLAQAALLGVCARIGGALGHRHVEQLLRAIPAQADIGASVIAHDLDFLTPFADDEVLAFVAALREETAARATALGLRVQRIVAQELEVQSLGRRLPAAARPVLDDGMARLLASRLLRYGVDHRMWHDAVDRLAQVLHALEPRSGSERSLARGELIEALRTDFTDSSLPPPQVDALIEALQRCFGEIDARNGGATSPSLDGAEETLLREVLQPEAWFRVYRSGGATTQWLRLDGWTPGETEARFSAFDHGEQYRVSIRTLSEDLRQGRTEPVDPAPQSQTALLALRRR
jgi:hypothetical protein